MSWYETVTVYAGQTDSAEVTKPGWAKSVSVTAPAGLAEVATITRSHISGGTFTTQQSAGVDVGPSAASKTCTIIPAPRYIKIHLGGAAAANRAFIVEWGE